MNAVVARSKAAALAEWTQLPDDRFGEIYASVIGSRLALDWPLVVAMAGTAPRLMACEEAEARDFLDELARVVANEEYRAKRPAEQVKAMLIEVCSYGVMQGMTDREKGFMSAEVLLQLAQANDAFARVLCRSPAGLESHLGTAFLVREDMVLTAAHVVMDVERIGDEERWADHLRSGLVFRFKARANQSSGHWVEVLPAADKPLVCFAPPFGTPAQRFDRPLDAKGKDLLDYALIRLAQRVGHVTPVEIGLGAPVKKGKLCWAFGFPAGNSLAMDVDKVTVIHDEAGRWLHLANTAAGMSGGCCFNHEGQAAGLHEGTLDLVADGAPTTMNRGVSLVAIRKAQRSKGKDPLDAKGIAEGLELQDPLVVAEFYRSGKRLAGDAYADAWRTQVTSALNGVDPDGTLPAFHPWFARAAVDAWIDESDANERLCLIHGEPGAGKSFCARILGERLDPRKADLLMFTPTQLTSLDWMDAISKVLVPEGSEYRTAAASIRYRDFNEVISELSGRSIDSGRICHVVLDFGPGGGIRRFIDTHWVEFVAALAAAESIRVMLIDLDEAERAVMIDRLAARAETENVGCQEIEVQHLRAEDFRKYIKNLAAARGWSLPASELTRLVGSVFRSDLPIPENMRTVTAALAAIKFEAANR